MLQARSFVFESGEGGKNAKKKKPQQPKNPKSAWGGGGQSTAYLVISISLLISFHLIQSIQFLKRNWLREKVGVKLV